MSLEFISEGIRKAIHLIITGDPLVMSIALRSIYVSGVATLIASVWSIPIGVSLGMHEFRGISFVRGLFNSLIGIPTVVLGLVLYLLLVPAGPFGFLDLIYTPLGISIGQAFLITPIVVSFSASAVEAVETDVRELAITLGAGRLESTITVLKEGINGILLSIVSGFNRAVAELGIAMMIGGNILVSGSALNTRVLTTAINMYTVRGEIGIGIALGIILMLIVFTISMILNLFRRERR
ncbi:ABC transporter permease [candidate division MSBL1 archaeon SCGC-AAA259I14]|uniref:ABC transporter permease n=1 Tax=candidate division MSBL1 archaeon SCGC-AAA259I14 TaxID=1698268 RepID=A0A133UTV1_9EURY|nr:ABC transporter permease [candidate division MSBL1 archaeon SCGC-AAA259I14]